MKIESSSKPVSTPLVKESRGHTASKASSAGSDEVQFSALSAQLSATSDGSQSFDAARVSEIKQAIAEGRFTINAGAIADSLINSAKELINSQRRA